MQRTNDLSKRDGEHRSIFFIEGGYDFARSIDGVGSVQHVPLDFSGLRLVHASIRWFDFDLPAALLSRRLRYRDRPDSWISIRTN
jgi:hypothetical protein